MPRRRIFWYLFPWLLGVVLTTMAAATWYVTAAVRHFHEGTVAGELQSLAEVAQNRILREAPGDWATTLDTVCKELGHLTHARFTVILPSGQVVADSAEDPARMANHADRPEFRDALQGKLGLATRDSDTVRARLSYVALPLLRDRRLEGAVRVSRPVTQIESAVRDIRHRIVLGAALTCLAAAGVSLWLARRLVRPLEEMRRGAERLAGGDLTIRLSEPDAAELADLARAMNGMAHQLAARVEAVTRQRNELEAILTSMTEGVLAVDTETQVISANHAAVALLGVAAPDIAGRPLVEVVRNPRLLRLVDTALQTGAPSEAEITLEGADGEHCVQVRGTGLHDGQGRRLGVVVVLTDVTRLRRLEQVRRDFVANVSHELRTPITSLKGFVETLLDGAMHEPENAERFLRIIQKHADRLNAIIEDLLRLASLEKDRETASLELADSPVVDVLRAAVGFCQVKADRRRTAVRVEAPADLLVRANRPLLEQAVINLLDNAINYSPEAGPVEVVAVRDGREVRIDVRDRGCGIASQHLPRIFERFYRVDKARSREVGGTGLGLAIVKHVMQAHGGSVSVTSEPGRGSTFTLRLPA